MEDGKHKKVIGNLWLSQDKSYLSGDITLEEGEKVRIIVFKNTRKRDGKQDSDYNIYLRKPKESIEPF